MGLKRFPGEELTPRQFEERLDAWRDGVRQRHAAQHYGVVSQYPDSKSRRNEWRLKPKKRK